ncbi:uncharacterized protein CANTADRAFT_49739 [Suhomyces tanzawaensis NRRL Y-17324]|uniref:DNA mismatch repair proteins mutS family domain-containing protein n=1 Tax=Suhomyces tanzawaensis NRRL Y-17324 TaxID=984487 RepID=A0A1E4SKE2_9ASCO|nr:uncharacterized protein CANTADRAFT_49739 [Suhomyces tanzawaensis NRRL Y-17324]ODV79968.1 hypothetical protein CANTADRAFT_49739 [Suhomyces tanzawaensis NRRL Y-17324]
MKKLIDSNPGCVCLIQVGLFYELYFDQASVFGPRLGLKVATRKTSLYSIPMAGFPVFQLQKFVKMLVQDCLVNVAIIDQYPSKDQSVDNIIHRKISRIVSPGTLVDETFLNYSQNNYLVAISLPPKCTKIPADPDLKIGLSWIDVSVGEFYVQQTTLNELMTDIARINPSEVLISKDFQTEDITNGNWYAPLHDLRKYFLRYHKTSYSDLKFKFKTNIQTTRKSLEEFSVREEAAMNLVLSYINVNLPERNLSLELPTQYWNQKYLQIDSRSREALELTERTNNGRNSTVGTLLNTIKKTVTPSGSRLLTQWIKSPMLDIDEIKYRQSYVNLFLENEYLKVSIRTRLSVLGDFVRSLQRLSLSSGDAVVHLLLIADGVDKLYELELFLIEEYKQNPKSFKTLGTLLKDFKVPWEISKEIQDTLHVEYVEAEESVEPDVYEEYNESEIESDIFGYSGSYSNLSLDKYKETDKPKIESEFLFSVRRDFNEKLAAHHQQMDAFLQEEDEFLGHVQDLMSTIDPKIKVKKKHQHGRYLNVIHISGKQKLIEEAHLLFEPDIREKRKSSLLYKPQEWNRLQARIDEKSDQIKEFENEIIDKLRIKVLDAIPRIRKVSKLVDFLDITTSFAVLAQENNLVCPKFTKTPRLNIKKGRHLVVESGLKEIGSMFIPNNTKIGSTSENLWIISGPNMGGKSTFLRQNALIVILAQIGSFVPAEKASLGIVDKIFTRIGASDDLFSDLSTFMVEMVETSNILKNATPNSLAIVDEIGRGTSGKEGLAIAYATLLSLLQVNKCRTLFATHFGKELELLLVANNINQNKIKYFRTRVLFNSEHERNLGEPESGFIIDHTLEPGISDRSYAIEVAQMAGFPKHALLNAQKALEVLETETRVGKN